MSERRRRVWKLSGLVAMLAILGLQAWPVDRSNPPVSGDIATLAAVPADVTALLRRACYDCHSNETAWPWYGYVAPISWQLAGHVSSGRAHLNLSQWDTYSPSLRGRKLRYAARALEAQEMPPATYLLMHGEAELSDPERLRLMAWLRATSAASAKESDDPGRRR